MCKSAMIFTILCSVCFAQTQNVALSGVVKLSSGTPVAGAKVSLAGMSSLSMLTLEDGTFSLKRPNTRVRSVPSTPLSRHFTFQGNSIFFTQAGLTADLDVKVYTNDGRIITSRTIQANSAEKNRITLPLLGSGIYYLAIKAGEREIVRPLVRVGKKFYCENLATAPAENGTIPGLEKRTVEPVVIAFQVV